MDRVTQLAVVAARGAFRHAGLSADALDPERAGVVIGTAVGGVGFMEPEIRRVCVEQQTRPDLVQVRDDLDPNTYGGFLAFSVSSEVARDLGLHGPTSTMATGCTAGLDAIGAATALIEAGLADVVVTGGVDAPLTPIVLTAFDNIKALTRRNADPTRASRPVRPRPRRLPVGRGLRPAGAGGGRRHRARPRGAERSARCSATPTSRTPTT